MSLIANDSDSIQLLNQMNWAIHLICLKCQEKILIKCIYPLDVKRYKYKFLGFDIFVIYCLNRPQAECIKEKEKKSGLRFEAMIKHPSIEENWKQ